MESSGSQSSKLSKTDHSSLTSPTDNDDTSLFGGLEPRMEHFIATKTASMRNYWPPNDNSLTSTPARLIEDRQYLQWQYLTKGAQANNIWSVESIHPEQIESRVGIWLDDVVDESSESESTVQYSPKAFYETNTSMEAGVYFAVSPTQDLYSKPVTRYPVTVSPKYIDHNRCTPRTQRDQERRQAERTSAQTGQQMPSLRGGYSEPSDYDSNNENTDREEIDGDEMERFPNRSTEPVASNLRAPEQQKMDVRDDSALKSSDSDHTSEMHVVTKRYLRLSTVRRSRMIGKYRASWPRDGEYKPSPLGPGNADLAGHFQVPYRSPIVPDAPSILPERNANFNPQAILRWRQMMQACRLNQQAQPLHSFAQTLSNHSSSQDIPMEGVEISLDEASCEGQPDHGDDRPQSSDDEFKTVIMNMPRTPSPDEEACGGQEDFILFDEEDFPTSPPDEWEWDMP